MADTKISALTAKTTLTGNDEFPISDSAASNATKRIIWTNIMGQAAAFVQTLTNKRVTPRVGSTTSSATPTINTDSYDIYRLTAQAAAITSFTTNLSGTPTHGQELLIEITDNATARAITWGASFASTTSATLPTTTTVSKLLRVKFLWDSADSTWDCVGTSEEA